MHNLCFSFLLGIIAIPREIENNAYAKFWGANKVHYGGCASGKYWKRLLWSYADDIQQILSGSTDQTTLFGDLAGIASKLEKDGSLALEI